MRLFARRMRGMQEYIVIAVLYSPFWIPVIVPVMLLTYHAATAEVWWKFSMQFLFIFLTAECAALAISILIERFLDDLWRNFPVPG